LHVGLDIAKVARVMAENRSCMMRVSVQ